jgi:membrane dipeptidase
VWLRPHCYRLPRRNNLSSISTADRGQASAEWGVKPEAARIHAESIVWDATFPFGPSCGSPQAHLDSLKLMRAQGCDVVMLTTVTDPEDMAATIRKIANDRALLRSQSEWCRQVYSTADIQEARQKSQISVVFSFQGTVPFERSLGLVDVYYRLGVRQALMAYNQKNHVGDGCHERNDGGLSRFGADLIREMNRVGMLVDCTHTGYRTARDVFEISRSPVIFSHSNPRALADHERNIPDDLIDACARSGGVIGINGVSIFLGGGVTPERVFRHIDHIVQRVGPEHVGIGLDHVSEPATLLALVRSNATRYPENQNYETQIDFGGPKLWPKLTEHMLDRGYSLQNVASILGGNWLRVANSVWR